MREQTHRRPCRHKVIGTAKQEKEIESIKLGCRIVVRRGSWLSEDGSEFPDRVRSFELRWPVNGMNIAKMSKDYSEWENIRDPIAKAAALLCDRDKKLFELKANERAITHRLAYFIEITLGETDKSWNIDCEYNRLGKDPKAYKQFPDFAAFRAEFLKYELAGLVSEQSTVEIFDRLWEADKLGRVYPDIIIHRRTKPERENNLCIIEVKTDWNAAGNEEKDDAKLRFFATGGYDGFDGYQWGLFLKFAQNGSISEATRYRLNKSKKLEVHSLSSGDLNQVSSGVQAK